MLKFTQQANEDLARGYKKEEPHALNPHNNPDWSE